VKRAFRRFVLSPEFQLSIWGALFRRFVKATRGIISYSPGFLLDTQAIERPHYAYCLLRAAELARDLGKTRISAIEFGVAGGNGLAFMVDFAREVERVTNVTIDCYGFDTGAGMPEPEGAKDLPYWFKAAQYRMDVPALQKRLPTAKLILGNIRDTMPRFLEEHDPVPIGAIFNDLDYWSSTKDSLRLFDEVGNRPHNFLPRICMYLDDIIGTKVEMYGPYNGQLAAVEESNAQRENLKIHLNQNLLWQPHVKYRFQIYYAHLFDHREYETYIGGDRQLRMEEELRLA
jgi:hypothetical protein